MVPTESDNKSVLLVSAWWTEEFTLGVASVNEQRSSIFHSKVELEADRAEAT